MGNVAPIDEISSAATGGPTPRPDATAAPIVVDLDGTLLKADLLHESVVGLLCQRPHQLLACLRHLLKGKAAFKRAVAERMAPDIEGLPPNQPVLDWLRQQRADGARLVLYSASDQSLVDKVSARFGIFDEACGSDGVTNLSGSNKYEAVARRYGPRFAYVGDSGADLAVWRRCGTAVLAGSRRLRRQLPGDVEVMAEFPRRGTNANTWRRALRLHQWAKNALILVPLLLSGLFREPLRVEQALQAVVAFGLLASATYLINDIFDLSADRRHRTKRFRPLASGELALSAGTLAVPALLLLAVAVSWTLPRAFAEVAALYTAVTLTYSMGLKRQPILDLLILAGLFTVRILAGIVVLGTAMSPWLLVFSMFFFGSLATIKRYTECAALLREGQRLVPGRGYRPDDAPWLMAMGAASGFASILVFFIYLTNAVAQLQQFSHPAWLWSICPVLAYWMGRVWLLAGRGEMRDDPIAFALKDRVSLLLGAFVAASILLAIR